MRTKKRGMTPEEMKNFKIFYFPIKKNDGQQALRDKCSEVKQLK